MVYSKSSGDSSMAFTKWIIGALSTLVLVFGTLYINNVAAQQTRLQSTTDQHTNTLLQYEQRITTLEESKRNTESLLMRMSADIEEIKRAVVR